MAKTGDTPDPEYVNRRRDVHYNLLLAGCNEAVADKSQRVMDAAAACSASVEAC